MSWYYDSSSEYTTTVVAVLVFQLESVWRVRCLLRNAATATATATATAELKLLPRLTPSSVNVDVDVAQEVLVTQLVLLELQLEVA